MAIRPLGNRVLVKVLQEDLVTKGGIHIPDAVKHPSCQGLVVATGPDVVEVQPGDWVLFEPYQEEEYSVTFYEDPADLTTEYILMPEGLVMGVLGEPE